MKYAMYIDPTQDKNEDADVTSVLFMVGNDIYPFPVGRPNEEFFKQLVDFGKRGVVFPCSYKDAGVNLGEPLFVSE